MCLESFEKEIDNISFRTYHTRLWSFKNWNGKVKPELLASCGFYYLLKDDICKCFYCGVEIFKWKYFDCPIIEHIKYNNNCNLIESLNEFKNFKETCANYELFKNSTIHICFVFIISCITYYLFKHF